MIDGPYMDDQGDFFAILGEHRKLHFLREWKHYTAMTLYEICEGREMWPNIRITQATIVDRDDPDSWPWDIREQVEDADGWFYEWDQWMRLDPDGPHTVTVYSA